MAPHPRVLDHIHHDVATDARIRVPSKTGAMDTPQKGSEMKNDKVKFLLCTLFFIVLAVITFRCVWGADMVFSASDVNLGGLAHRKNAGIDLFSGFFGSNPVLGSANHSYSLFNLFVLLVPLHLFSDLFYGTILVLGSLSLVWFLRLWNRSWFASVFGALVAFWFNSIILAAVGHVYKMEVLAFSVVSLCFIEKGKYEYKIQSSKTFYVGRIERGFQGTISIE